MVKTGELVEIVLRDGTTLEGYTLLRNGHKEVTVGYDGAEDPAVDGRVIGERRIILREDIAEITPIG